MRQYLTIMKRMTAFIFAFLIVFNSLPVADVYASDFSDDPYVDDIPYSDPDHVDGDGHTHEGGDGHTDNEGGDGHTDNEGGDGHTEEDGHVHTDDCGHLHQTDYVPDNTTLPEDALSESKAAANSASDPDLFGDLGGDHEDEFPETFTIFYDKNADDAVGTMESQQMVTGSEENILNYNQFTRTGYKFLGWNTAPDGSGNFVTDNSCIIHPTVVKTSEITLYAQWEIIEYTLTCNEIITNTSTEIKFTVLTASDIELYVPVKEGYHFLGWYTNYYFNTVFQGLDASNPADTTIYAQWASNEYTIVYDKNSDTATGTMKNQTAVYDIATTLYSNAFTNKGYAFVGWSLVADPEAEDTVPEYIEDNSQVIKLTSENNGKVTLYAQWKPGDYTVTYSNLTDEELATIDDSYKVFSVTSPVIDLDSLVVEREGYTFGGWFFDSAFKKKAASIDPSVAKNQTVYAKWTPVKYTVSFDKSASDATGKMNNQSYTYGQQYKLTKNAFSRKGYTFAGWTTDPESDEVLYTDSSYVKDLCATNGGTFTLYAVWTPTVYTITYNLGGIAVSSNDNATTYDVTKIESFALVDPVPESGAYTFGGWYTDKAYKKSATGITAGTTGNITFYAKWVIPSYKINYDPNAADGSVTGKMPSDTYTYNTSKALRANTFKRSGFVFMGWSLDPESEAATYVNKELVTGEKLSVNLDSLEVTLYAVWNNNFTISFDANGGEPVDDLPYTYGTAQSLPTPVREGYTFAGWYTDSTYRTKLASIAKTTSGNYNLIAKWTPIKYVVTYNSNSTGVSGRVNNQTLTYDTSAKLNDNKFTKKGYTFAGWSTNATPSDTDVIYANKADVLNLSSTNNAKVTLYAQWVPTEYTVTYHLNGGSLADEYRVTSYNITTDTIDLSGIVPTVDSLAYSFGGWYLDSSYKKSTTSIKKGTTGNIDLYAKWNAVNYTVTYNSNATDATGKMASDTYTFGISKGLRKNTFKRKGYVFMGWSLDKDSTEASFTDGASVNSTDLGITDQNVVDKNLGVTLYAVWSSTFTVTFEENGGSAVDDIVYTYGSTVKFSNPTREGYTFGGWYTDDGTFKKKVSSIGRTTGQNYTLYAKWNPIKYTITYNKNSKSATGSMSNQSVTYGTTVTLNTNKFTNKGSRFCCWNTKADGSGTYYNEGESVSNLVSTNNGKITLYAQWVKSDYSIIYHTEGGTIATNAISTYTYSSTVSYTLPTPTRDRYVFAGWYKDPSYKTIMKNNIIAKGTYGDLELYAKWTIDPEITYYYITYHDGDTTITDESFISSYSYNRGATYTLPTPVKEGYTFNGWYKDAALKSRLGLTIPKGSKGDLNLYAKWTPNKYKVTYNANAPQGLKTSGRMSAQTLNYGTYKSLSKNSYTLKGYNFVGWSTTKDGSSIVTNAQLVNGSEFTGSYTSNVTLYAVWEVATYTIAYVDPANAYNGNPTTYTCNDTFVLTEPEQMGNTFLGWYQDKNYRTKVTSIAKGSTGNKTLYAKWSVKQQIAPLTHVSHTFDYNTPVSVTASTCNEHGTAVYKCRLCDYVKTSELPLSDSHVYSDGIITKAATCTENGTMTYTCTKCGVSYTETIAATGHTKDEGTVTKAASCTETGTITYKCLTCGVAVNTQTIAIQDHNYAELVTDSTCTKEGTSELICITCGQKGDTKSIAKKDHNYEWVITKEPTCAQEGYKERKCTECGEIDSSTPGESVPKSTTHTGDVKYEITHATCTSTGLTTGICTECGEVISTASIAVKDHKYTDKTLVKDSTCTEEGYYEVRCEVCGQVGTPEAIAKKDHSCEWVVAKYPTNTEKGLKEYKCSECGYVSKTEETEPCAHASTRNEETVAANCKNPAHYKVICNDCGVVVDEDYFDPNGATDSANHDYSIVNVTQEPTCILSGKQELTCSLCGDKKTERINAPGHDYELVSTTSATCQAKGHRDYVCSVCGNEYTSPIAKLAHDWTGDYVITKEATCAETGTKELYCGRCNQLIRTSTISKKSHKYEWVTTVEPTTTTEGYKQYKCSVCGDVSKTETIPMIEESCKHTNTKKTLIKSATCKDAAHYKVTCLDCNEVIDADYQIPGDSVDKNNHIGYSVVTTKAATAKEDGIQTHTCIGCGDTYEVIIPHTTCPHGWVEVKYIDGGLYWQCHSCGEITGTATADDCKHIYYSYEYAERVKADENTWGVVDKLCSNCKTVLSTVKIHPYSEYHVTDENGEDVTLYGWFDDEYAKEVWQLTCDYREANGLNRLGYNGSVCQEASNLRCLEAAIYWGHTRPNKTRWNTVITQWTYGGENLAQGHTNPKSVMEGWKASPGHNANLLYGINEGNRPFKAMTVGVFHRYIFNEKYRYIPDEIITWSQNFTFYQY
ncbi:InlB B-repeat-containing protein [Butyrivibrio fibrisolvens]|uniref:InlB B-repeat-containing protein n=1 Tax=Butyrivibrio fibrisolvens TaxID=831 RepID=UPI0004145E30|nr:InlB B-repeat-containing protein [Butyrivibrio fibrisolvens]